MTKDNLRAFRELYRILLDPKLEDYQSRGTLEARPFQAWGLVVGGEGVEGCTRGTNAGDPNGLFRKSRSGSSAACPWWGKVRGVNKAW